MPHFYINPQNIQKNIFTIDKQQFHYLANVRRFEAGSEINLFDGLGNCFLGKIEEITKTSIIGKIISKKTFRPLKTKISLYTAIAKGERFDWLIEKSSEIGVYKLIPTIYSRSVICEISPNKLERYGKISLSASSQSERSDIMPVTVPVKFSDAVDFVSKQKNTLNILPWECEEKKNISETLANSAGIENINIFIGPEGGFENSEIDKALQNNFKIITLGKNILRTETAALVCAAVIFDGINN